MTELMWYEQICKEQVSQWDRLEASRLSQMAYDQHLQDVMDVAIDEYGIHAKAAAKEKEHWDKLAKKNEAKAKKKKEARA